MIKRLLFLVNTTSTPVIINATWNFNGDTTDQYNVYNGAAMNSPTYTTGYTNLTSTALSLIGSSSQYVQISEPFLSLSYVSFTVEIWLYPTALVSTQNYGLFGQCQTTSTDLQSTNSTIQTNSTTNRCHTKRFQSSQSKTDHV